MQQFYTYECVPKETTVEQMLNKYGGKKSVFFQFLLQQCVTHFSMHRLDQVEKYTIQTDTYLYRAHAITNMIWTQSVIF